MKVICECGHNYTDHDEELFCLKGCGCTKNREEVLLHRIMSLKALLFQAENCLEWMDYSFPNHPGYGVRKDVLNRIVSFWKTVS